VLFDTFKLGQHFVCEPCWIVYMESKKQEGAIANVRHFWEHHRSNPSSPSSALFSMLQSVDNKDLLQARKRETRKATNMKKMLQEFLVQTLKEEDTGKVKRILDIYMGHS
jgi:hypothetical protein